MPAELIGNEEFALLGLNPKCGCPLAIDLTATPLSASEFAERGMLLSYMHPTAALELWENASWPCLHAGSQPKCQLAEPPAPSTVPTLRIVR